MTEYGRGPGSEPWHPEDPLYGDGGWGGQHAHQGGQAPYGGQPQQYPEQPQAQYGDWGDGGQAGHGHAQQQYDQYQQYGQQYGQQQYADPSHQQYAGPAQQQSYDPQQQQQQQQQQQYGDGGWATGGQHQVSYAPDPADPYAQQTAAYGGQQPDFYGTPDAYPPPQPPGRRRAEPEPEPDWDPGPDQGEHAFFAGGNDDDADDDDTDEAAGRRGRGDRRGRGGKGTKDKKSRSGCACLVVALVFGGGLAGVSYFGYQFYQDRFGAAPDFAGDGSSVQVTVEIPKGASGAEIGRRLKDAGVVKSVDAFVAAQSQNPDGEAIQAGAYLLKKEMSAASAVKLMLDPKSQNNVVVPPGQRNVKVYAAIDERLGLEEGTTEDVAEKKYKSFGLPKWANNNKEIKDPLEGFLYPGTYPAAKGMKPESVLREMVSRANAAYDEYDLEAKAKAFDLENPLELITVASLVQAEGKTEDDFRKMAEVIYNRLKPTNTETNQLLQFDSTFNYLKGQSNIHITESEIKGNFDPYNTYTNKGLPPGPIGNPGADALKAMMNPTDDGWLYFVATDGVHRTEFATNHDDFLELKEKFDANTGN
ncbi:endolytic transglycosylase MltG [Streptomyces cadmiisoli]|uniref:endolytic transglycosylase MltG n=1 Tax=Streptomyces cadmiisoli TaxID=2184053 RepID=UPI003D74250F